MYDHILNFILGFATGMIFIFMVMFILMKPPRRDYELGEGSVKLNMVLEDDPFILTMITGEGERMKVVPLSDYEKVRDELQRQVQV